MIKFVCDIVHGIEYVNGYVIDYAIWHISEKVKMLSLNWLLHWVRAIGYAIVIVFDCVICYAIGYAIGNAIEFAIN